MRSRVSSGSAWCATNAASNGGKDEGRQQLRERVIRVVAAGESELCPGSFERLVAPAPPDGASLAVPVAGGWVGEDDQQAKEVLMAFERSDH